MADESDKSSDDSEQSGGGSADDSNGAAALAESKENVQRTNAAMKGDEAEHAEGKNPSSERQPPSADGEYIPRSVRHGTESAESTSSSDEGSGDDSSDESDE